MESAPKQGFFKRNSVTILTALGLLFSATVAGVVGWASWQHIVEVGQSAGEAAAHLLPVAIDGLMLTGTVMGAVDRLRGFKTRGWAVVGLWTGSILTLAFNMLSAWGRGPKAMLIAVLFAVTLLIAVETMFHPSQRPLTKAAKKIKEIVVSDTIAAPQPEQIPVVPVSPEPAKTSTGQRGRKPGPQPNQPRKRTGGRPRVMGAGDGRPVSKTPQATKPAEVTAPEVKLPQVTKPVEVALDLDLPEDHPLAMGESLADLVGGESRSSANGAVVS